MYITSNWTDEMLNLMVEKLIERKQKEADSANKGDTVPIEALAATSNGGIEVVRR